MLRIAYILFYISIFSVLIPLFFLLRKKQNFKSSPTKVLSILLFASAFSDFGSYILFKMGKSNIQLNNTYIIIQFFLLSYIYYLLLKWKTIIYIASFIFVAFFIVNILFIQSFSEFQSWVLLVEGIIVLIYSIIYYRQILSIIPPINLRRFPFFWLNTAVYFYFTLNLCLFAMTNYIFKNMEAEIGITAWGFHNFNNTVKNIIFTVAICYAGVRQDEKEMPKLFRNSFN